MFFKIILLFTILTITLSISSGQQCDPSEKIRIDGTYAKLLVLGGSGRKFPEDKKGQLKKFCDQSIEWIKEIDAYKDKCLKTYPKQTTGVVVYSVRNVINQYCKKDSRKLNDLISSTKCANDAKKEIDQCYTTLIDKFQGAINADVKMRIPHVCCDYFKFLNCIKEKSLKVKGCDEKKLDNMANFIREIFNNLVDFICGEYVESSDKCDKIATTPKKTKKQGRRTKSFMLPLIDSISTLPEA